MQGLTLLYETYVSDKHNLTVQGFFKLFLAVPLMENCSPSHPKSHESHNKSLILDFVLTQS